MWASSRYILIMSFAAMIALARGFIVAGVLDVPSFGLYATIVAVGMFSSALVSFGEIERTIKTFPRLWVVERHRRSVVDRTDESARVMILRAGGLLIVLLTCTFLDVMRSFAQMGVFVVLIALNAALASLYASAIRATGDVELLAGNTLFRAIIVIVFGLSGAYFFGWQGAVLGEVLATIVGILITRYSVVEKTISCAKNNGYIRENDGVDPPFDSGLWLFFAALLASVPVYLDRAFVASVFGTAMVGTFGFLMLFVTGANTFTGIIAQKVGPQLIKIEYLGESINAQLKFAGRWLALIFTICFAGMMGVTLLFVFGPAKYFFEKFHLDLNLIAAAGVMCTLQVGVILDFIMISRNQERAIFFAACLYLAASGVVVLLVLWLKLSLVDFIWLLVLAKIFHIAAQVGFIGRIWHAHKRQLEGVK